MENKATWLDGPGHEPRVRSAPIPEPVEGQLRLIVSQEYPA